MLIEANSQPLEITARRAAGLWDVTPVALRAPSVTPQRPQQRQITKTNTDSQQLQSVNHVLPNFCQLCPGALIGGPSPRDPQLNRP